MVDVAASTEQTLALDTNDVRVTLGTDDVVAYHIGRLAVHPQTVPVAVALVASPVVTPRLMVASGMVDALLLEAKTRPDVPVVPDAASRLVAATVTHAGRSTLVVDRTVVRPEVTATRNET